MGDLGRDRAAAAATEFALIGPVMATLMLGVIELTNAMRVQAKLDYAAGQLAEMVAGQSAVTEGSAEGAGGTLGDMCTAIAENMLPYNTGTLSAYIGSTTVVQVSGSLEIAPDWINDTSCPSSVTLGSAAETTVLTGIASTPRSFFTADGTPQSQGGSLVLGYTAVTVQLTYTYGNLLTFMLGPSLTFTAVAAARPRDNVAPTCTYSANGSPTPCPSAY